MITRDDLEPGRRNVRNWYGLLLGTLRDLNINGGMRASFSSRQCAKDVAFAPQQPQIKSSVALVELEIGCLIDVTSDGKYITDACYRCPENQDYELLAGIPSFIEAYP